MKKMLLLSLALMLMLPVVTTAGEQDDDDWVPLQQGTVSFRVGYFMPRGESDLWLENVDTFTYEVGDFDNFMVGVEVNWFLNNYMAVGAGFDFYNDSVSSEYRDFVGEDGFPIEQNIELTTVPIFATLKFMPLGNGSPGYGGERGNPFVPWVGAGLTVVAFTYEETGEFIDFTDDTIFDAQFLAEDEAALGVHVAAGIVIPLDLKYDIFGEVRYLWAEGDLGEDFIGFDPIDLGGVSFHFGASYRF